MAFFIKTVKNMMAQHVEHYSTLHQIVDNESVIVNEKKKLLSNRIIRNNQVNSKYTTIVNITI